eukprot:851165_1
MEQHEQQPLEQKEQTGTLRSIIEPNNATQPQQHSNANTTTIVTATNTNTNSNIVTATNANTNSNEERDMTPPPGLIRIVPSPVRIVQTPTEPPPWHGKLLLKMKKISNALKSGKINSLDLQLVMDLVGEATKVFIIGTRKGFNH